MKRFSQLTQTATEADLVVGNFLAIDVPGAGGATKKVPGNLVAPRSSIFSKTDYKNLENLYQIAGGVTISGVNIDRGLDENGDYNNNVVGHARTGRKTIAKNCAVVLDSDVFCFRAFSYSSDSGSPWSNYLLKKYEYGNILITNSTEPYYSFEFVRKDGGAIVSGDLSTIEAALKVYAITDASLSTEGLPADAKKMGDEIAKIQELDKKLVDNLFASEGRPIVSLTVGSGIRDGNGETYSNTARMRTGRLDLGNQRLRIQCDGTKYLMSPHYYTTDSGTWTDAYTGKYDDYTDDIIVADPSLFVGILIKRVDGADVSSTDAETFLSSVKVSRTNSAAKKVVRILGVGNSHTRDVFRWLWKIADSVGVQVILGQAYLGGTTLKNHYDNILSSSTVYTYEKYTGKNPTSTANISMNEVIEDEPWDICIMQQASYLSGVYSSFVSPEFDVKDLIDKIKELCTNKLIKFGLACDWANVAGYTDDPEWIVYYGGDPEVMYEDIQTTIPQVASYCGNISYITNQGKAFKLARDNQYLSAIGDDFSRDKNHADYGIGRYCAGMVYAISLLGINWNDVTWFPTSDDDPNISNSDAFLANLARQAAFACNSIL